MDGLYNASAEAIIYSKTGSTVRISIPIHGNESLKLGLQRHLMKFGWLAAVEFSVRATIALLPHLNPRSVAEQWSYMPHIVVGDPQQREAMMIGNSLTEKYLGVWVTDAPDELSPGHVH